MMMSPDTWRKWLKPRLGKVIAAARAVKPDMAVWYHSDGDCRGIIGDLIEIGVTILNPIQPECMDPAWVKKRVRPRSVPLGNNRHADHAAVRHAEDRAGDRAQDDR